MSLVRRIARPLLAAPFIFEGVQTALRPEHVLEGLDFSIDDVESQVAKTDLPVSAETMIRIAGGVAVVAGAALALNKRPRLAAVALLASTTVGVAGRKRLWELSGEERLAEIRSITGDLGLFGGVLLAVVDTDGRPSVAYRVEKMIDRGQKAAEQKKRELDKATKGGKKASSKAIAELDRTLAKKIKAA